VGRREIDLTFSLCRGLWIPVIWLVGSIMVAVQLKPAPPSKHKRWMMAFLVLTPLALVLFIAVMAGYGIDGAPSYTSTYVDWDADPERARLESERASAAFEAARMVFETNLEAISGVLLTVYGLCGCLFIAFADITFRSMQGPLTWSLGSPLFLRGVHLGLNLAGMFTLMPLFSFVGIPATLLNLRKIKTHSPGLFTASNVFGILSFVFLTAIVLLLIIAGSIRGRSYQTFVGSGTVCKPDFPDQQFDTTTDTTWTIATTLAETALTTSIGTWPVATTAPWSDSPTESPTPPWTRCYPGEPIYETRTESGLTEFPAWITLLTLTLFQWIFNFLFIGFADTLILKAIGGKGGAAGGVAGGVVASSQLVHPCPSCSSPLQFVRTGPTTQVQCYKCQAVVEFQTEA
jgi:hypothetical protein